MVWACGTCTLSNENDHFLTCALCGAERTHASEGGGESTPEASSETAPPPPAIAPPPRAIPEDEPRGEPPAAAAKKRPPEDVPERPAAKLRLSQTVEQKKFVVILLVDAGDSEHQAYLASCKSTCAVAVHEHCLQLPGTRHLTLCEGHWTEAEAAHIRFANAPSLRLPLRLPLRAPKPWKACLALGVDASAAAAITQLVAGLSLPQGAETTTTQKALHLSLYRGFGRKDLAPEISKMRAATSNAPLGSVNGVRVAVKEVGADYATCRPVL